VLFVLVDIVDMTSDSFGQDSITRLLSC